MISRSSGAIRSLRSAARNRKYCMPSVFFVFLRLLCAARAESQELILSTVVNGYIKQPVHVQTTIRVVNLSTSAVDVTLEAYQSDGSPVRILELFPIPRQGTKTVLKLESLGSVEAFTAGDVPSLNGWARLTWEDGPPAVGPGGNVIQPAIQASAEVALISAPVGPHPICTRPSTDIVTRTQAVAAKSSTKFSGYAVIRPFRKSAYAIANPSSTARAEVFLSLLDFSGKLVASGRAQIPPQGRISRFLSELVADAPADFMGSLRITSDLPIAASAVNVLLPEGKWEDLPMISTTFGACIQIIRAARDPLTGECRVFPTPCDVPEAWEVVAACK